MSGPGKPKSFSRRAMLRLIAAVPLLSSLGFVRSYAASDDFIEVGGWILKRGDLRRKTAR